MSTKAKSRTVAAVGCALLALAVFHCLGGNPGAMPTSFVIWEVISELGCGSFLLYHAKRPREKQKRDDSQ